MKHRIHSAIDATHHHYRGQPRWVWWADCGRCGETEWWDTWELAVWYLELHVRTSHGA